LRENRQKKAISLINQHAIDDIVLHGAIFEHLPSPRNAVAMEIVKMSKVSAIILAAEVTTQRADLRLHCSSKFL
jgi:hypothetical protein